MKNTSTGSRLSRLDTENRESLYRDVGGDEALMREVIHLTSSVPASGIPSDGAGVPGSRIPTVASSLSMSSVSPSSNPAGGGSAAPGSPAVAEARSAAAGPRFSAAADGFAPTKVVPGGAVTAKGRQDVGTELQNQAQGLSSAGDPGLTSASPSGGDGRAPTASSRSHVNEAGGRAAAGDGAAAAAGAPVAFAVGAGKDGSTAEAGATQAGEQNSLLSAPPHPMHDQAAGPPDAEDIDHIPDDDPQLHTLPDGAVGRRAPANPLNSPLVARLIGGKRKKRPKVKDPKLLNNPLRGRLLVCISTTALLFWIFLWELLYNYTSYNGRCVSAVYYPDYKLTEEKEREPFVIRYGYGACDHNLGSLAKPRATLGRRASDKGWPTDLVPNGSAGSSNAEWDAPNPRIFRVLGGLETNYIRNYGEIFRLFSSMYLHGGWLHILINISCQIQMFWIIEPDWGFWRTTLLFFLGGITGSLLSAVADPCNITVGSSGAMYALLAALIPYCVEYWKSIPRPVCILIFMIVVLIVGIITGLSGFTDNYAHIGGCVGGILWGFASITTVSACDKCTLGERMATTPPFSWCVSKQTQEKLLERAKRRKAEAVRRRKIQAAHKKKAGGARGKAMYALKMRLQEEGRPPCKMSFREWFVRGLAAGGLIIFWVVMFLYLLDPTLYEKYPPPGQLKFEGWLFCKCGTIVYEAKQTIGNLGKFWCFSSEKDVDFYLKR